MRRPVIRHPARHALPALLAVPALAIPALAAAAVAASASPSPSPSPAGAHSTGSIAQSITLERVNSANDPATSAAPACTAWRPVIPGLLYLGTAPVLTIGGVPLLGSGTCLPAGNGRSDSLQIGLNLAIPPRSICAAPLLPLPLLRVSLGLTVGVPDPAGYDPCRMRVPLPPAPPPLPRPVAPSPPRPARPVPPSPPQVARPIPPPYLPPHRTSPPPPATSPPPLAITPAQPPRHAPPPAPARLPAALPAPPAAPPAPAPAQAPPPAALPAAARPAAAPPHHVARAHPRSRPQPAAAKPAPPAPWPNMPIHQQQAAATTYKPGRPVMPVGVLVTVVMTPCVVTVAARLGKLMASRG